MDINDEVLKEWYSAVQVANDHFNNYKINEFKIKHPLEYSYISRFFRLRTELKGDIECLLSLGPVQWFTLTYDDEHDKNLETTKRRSAFKFLNEVFIAFLLVEELGEENGRYHIHGFGVYRIGKGFDDFRQWNCRQSIRTIYDQDGARKGAKYLTKYAVKEAPRLRRSKSLISYKKSFKRAKTLKIYGFKSCCACHILYARLKLNKKEVIDGLLNAPVIT